MAIRVTRRFRPFIALALVSMALTACSSATPTAPSSRSTSDAAPNAVTASVSSASVTTGAAKLNAADTIKINQGTLALGTSGAGTVTLQGSHGFRFDGRVYTSGLTPSYYCGSSSPCQPGATVEFTATWLGSDIPGTVRLQGDEFSVGSLNEPGGINPVLTGSFVAPAHVGDTASVTVPFTVSGLLLPAEQRPPFQLTGGGDVTFTLEWQAYIGGWAITFSSFDFDGGRPD